MVAVMATTTFELRRAGSEPEDAIAASNAMDAFATSAREKSPILIMTREKGAIEQYLVVRSSADRHVAQMLAHAVGAKPVALSEEETLVLSPKNVFRLAVPIFNQNIGRSTMAGQSPFLVTKAVASSLVEDGQWVAVAFRAPSGRESKWWSKFLRAKGIETHHSLESDSVVTSYYAGGSDASSSREALRTLAAAMPGFNEHHVTRRFTSIVPALGALALAVLATVVAIALPAVLAPLLQQFAPFSALVALAFVPPFAWCALLAAKRWRVLRRDVPVEHPRSRFLFPRPPKTTRDANGNEKVFEGDRPFVNWVFKVQAASFVGVVSPHVGGESGSASTTERAASAEVVSAQGFCFGLDKFSRRVHLPDVSAFEGVAIEGAAGKGKTQFQAAQFAYLLSKRATEGNNSLIFFDTKGGTYQILEDWCRRMNVPVRVIHVADDPWRGAPRRRQNSDVIDVLAFEGDADQRARFIADQMKQSLDEGDIRGQSLETLTKVFTAACAITDEMVDAAREQAFKEGRSFIPLGNAITPVSIAGAFLGEPDTHVGELLYAQLGGKASKDMGKGLVTDAVRGYQALHSIYGPDSSPAARRQILLAPRNKISLMQGAQWFWDTADHTSEVGTARPGSGEMGFMEMTDPVNERSVLTWKDILTSGEVVIINSGTAPVSGSSMNYEATELVTSMIFYSMRAAIEKYATNWRDQGRKIRVMADELSMIASSNAEMVEWLRDKGRSYGVELSFATQRHSQLPSSVKQSFLSFGTLLSFTQDDEEVAREIASNLAGDGSQWEGKDIVNLPAYNVVVRTRTSKRLPAFTAALTNFEEHPDLFDDYQSGARKLPGEV